MPTPDQVQRVVYEIALFQATIKSGSPMSEQQRHVLKHRLYQMIFEIECDDRASTPSDQTSLIA